ncbi:MAG: bifunctional riboflavin kinase/FAD synthetase [Gammaproteobacteria bacterium]
MRLLRGRIRPEAIPGGAVLTIGKFNGLHRGHRALLDVAAEEARARELPLVMLCFEPLPGEFFKGVEAEARLARFASQWRLIETTGLVDVVACLRFDAALAAQSAEDFVKETLVTGLTARAVVVGEEFRFGRQRKGDLDLLERLGWRRGFATRGVAPVADAGRRISSSRVREALTEHRLDEAASLLGRPFRVYGRVRAGDGLGRRLGFPTANLALGHRPPPLAGVYLVRAGGLPGGPHHGMANVGERPTVNGRRRLLEIYFPEFAGDLYGRLLAVDFLFRLRDEERFENLDALRAAIAADVNEGERWLDAHGLEWDAENVAFEG